MIIRKSESQGRHVWLTLLVVNVIGGGAGILTSFLTNRILGPNGRGELAAIQNIPMMISVFAGLGLSESAVYFIAKFPKAAKSITQRAVVLALFGGLFFSVVAFFIIPLLVKNPQTISASRSIIWLIIAVPLFSVAYQPLRALGWYRLWGCLRLYNTGALIVVLLVAYKQGTDSASTIAKYYAVAQYLSAGVAVWVMKFYDGAEKIPEISNKKLLSFGIPSSLSTLPQILNLRLDQVFLMGIVARSDLGFYVAAVSWGAIVSPPYYAIAQWIMPHLSSMKRGSAQIYARRLSLGVIGFSLGLYLLAVPITNFLFEFIMGRDFGAAVQLARIMVWASITSGMIVVFEEMYRGIGKPRVVLAAELAGLLITLPGLVMFVPEYGIQAAAIVSVVSYFVVALGLLSGLWLLKEVK